MIDLFSGLLLWLLGSQSLKKCECVLDGVYFRHVQAEPRMYGPRTQKEQHLLMCVVTLIYVPCAQHA